MLPSDSVLFPEPSVRYFIDERGRCPFFDWFNDLRDRKAQQIIVARLARVRINNFGDFKHVGNGVLELRINFGPGYRVYFGVDGKNLILVLIGGSKRSQVQDIGKAHTYWENYLWRSEK